MNEFSYLNRLIGVNENGDPTGLVKEHARKIFKGHPNLWGNAEITEKVYKDSARILAESGITSVLDAALRDYEIVKFAGIYSGHKAMVIPLPKFLGWLQAFTLEKIPGKTLMSRDNLRSLTVPSVASEEKNLVFNLTNPTSIHKVASSFLTKK